MYVCMYVCTKAKISCICMYVGLASGAVRANVPDGQRRLSDGPGLAAADGPGRPRLVRPTLQAGQAYFPHIFLGRKYANAYVYV